MCNISNLEMKTVIESPQNVNMTHTCRCMMLCVSFCIALELKQDIDEVIGGTEVCMYV